MINLQHFIFELSYAYISKKEWIAASEEVELQSIRDTVLVPKLMTVSDKYILPVVACTVHELVRGLELQMDSNNHSLLSSLYDSAEDFLKKEKFFKSIKVGKDILSEKNKNYNAFIRVFICDIEMYSRILSLFVRSKPEAKKQFISQLKNLIY